MSVINPAKSTKALKYKSRSKLHLNERNLAYLLLLPAAVLLFMLAVIPFIHVFLKSLQDDNTGSFIGLDNYVWALNNSDFYTSLVNTLVWTFGGVILEILLGLGVALLLHKKLLFRGIARALVLFPYLVPTIVAVLIWKYMFNDLVGVINYALISIGVISSPILWLSSEKWAMFSVILVGTWKFFPFVVIALLGILQAISQDQYEAADIDGASPLQKFWYITFPSILPVLIITALLRTIWNFDKFDIIYLLTGGGPLNATKTLPLMTYFKAFTDFQMGKAAAIAVLSFTLLSIILVVYLKVQGKAEERL
jgi:multiple sugar transport system permease protein